MGKSKIIIYGTGGIAELISVFLSIESDYKICGYCIENRYGNNLDTFNGQILVDFDKIEELYPPSEYVLFVVIGNNYARERIFSESKMKGYSMISHITKSVLRYNDLNIGENASISGSTSIYPLDTIGDNSFIMGLKIGHHCRIGNHALLSCTTLGRHVTVGDYSFLGLNSAVQHKTNIAEKNIIGMGCNIHHNTESNSVYGNSKATVKRVVLSEQTKDSYI